jgi:LacI family transcriptional regulator
MLALDAFLLLTCVSKKEVIMVTMKQVADLAGVSRSTVSFVLNESPLAKNIPLRTQDKVLAAARKLGYRPNEIAQSLITGKTKVLGFVTTQMSREFVSRMLWGAMEAVDQEGYYLKVFPVSSEESAAAVLDNLFKRNVAAVILQGLDSAMAGKFQDVLAEHQIPCCLLGSSFSPASGIRVVSDDSQGAESAIDYLVSKGHRKILFLNGQSDWPAFAIRGNAAVSGAKRSGVKLSAVSLENYRPGLHGLEDITAIRDRIIDEISKVRGKCTGIFCANDVLGVLAVQACHRLGIAVPEQMSVVGYSVSVLSQVCDPALTSVQQPHYEMGRTAAAELVAVLKTEDCRLFSRAIEIKLPTGIVEGGTVSTAKKT